MMRRSILLLLLLLPFLPKAQVINESFSGIKPPGNTFVSNDIEAQPFQVKILVKVIYNAVPDGYYVTFTHTWIGKDPASIENVLLKKIDSIAGRLKPLKIERKHIRADLISFDPVFDFNVGDSAMPSAFKVTQNITFTIHSLEQVRDLALVCMKHGVKDILNAIAYVNDSKPVYDSLYRKTVEILNMKKKLCTDAGYIFPNGKATVSHYKDVLYPNERYLTAMVRNASLFRHHVSQNTTLNLERRLEVDSYYDLNLKDADFVFNRDKTGPVIQFYSHFTYGFIAEPTEDELRKKISEELEKKNQKTFYIIDKSGNLKKVEM